jgi:hypothetical protein
LIEKNIEDPQGYFFMAATFQAQMIDFESDNWEKDFYQYINLTIKKADELMSDKAEKTQWPQFYKGSALLYLAFVDGRKGKYLPAIHHGLAGISLLKKVAEKQPDFAEANFGVGSYNYWRSRITRLINWLPLISDERESGIQMVKQASATGKFTRYAALNELIWILIDAGKPDEALAYAQTGLEKFPQSRFFLWGAAKSACANEKFDLAIFYFNKILDSILNEDNNNHYNEFICRLNLTHCYLTTSKHDEATQQMNSLKSLQLDLEIHKKLKKQKKRLAELEKDLMLETGSMKLNAGSK